MPTNTTNYSWSKPDVNGSSGAWGGLLNTIIDSIDSIVKAVSDVANAALPKAGGTMTGELEVLTERYTTVDLGTIATNANFELDLDAGNFFFGTVTAAVTLSFKSGTVPASSRFFAVVLEITNGGTNVSWPTSVKWPGGTAPALQASGVDVVSMYTRDGGTTWRAALAHGDSS